MKLGDSDNHCTTTLLSLRKSCDKLISESVDIEDGDSGGVLEELLLLWMITSQSVCLVPDCYYPLF